MLLEGVHLRHKKSTNSLKAAKYARCIIINCLLKGL